MTEKTTKSPLNSSVKTGIQYSQLVIDSCFRENDRKKGAFFEGKYDLTILDLIAI